MAKKKVLHYGNLLSFWSKAEAWITLNFEALFNLGEEFEKDINDLKSLLDNRIVVIKDDEYTEEQIMSVINSN